MKYKPVPLDNGTTYMIGIPETATEEFGSKDEIILELHNKNEELKNRIQTLHNSDYTKCPKCGEKEIWWGVTGYTTNKCDICNHEW